MKRHFPCARSLAILAAAISLAQARTLTVGPGKAYATPSQAARAVADGDTVLIDPGTYRNQEAQWRVNNLTLRATSRWAHLIAPATISNGKAIFVILGRNTVVENIRFSGARVPSKNGAGIRQHGVNLTVRGCYFHDNQNGILGGGDATSNVVVENSEFARNGHGDGYSHNLYIAAVRSFTLRASNTHHAKIGHNVKSRAAVNHILYNRIMDESDGTSSYSIDLPDGGDAYIIGNAIQQGPLSGNGSIISYGAEGVDYVSSSLHVVNNTLVNDRSGGNFVRVVAGFTSPVRLINNLIVGSGTVLSGPGEKIANVTGTTNDLADRARYDYHLRPGSVAIDRGQDPGSYGGIDLAPTQQYLDPASTEARPEAGPLDAGAFEFEP